MSEITVKNMKILVCCHKPSKIPESPYFLPIQVGKAISNFNLGMTGDNTGDNISALNKNFCELTALYWAWKNIKQEFSNLEYIGLCHYRRFFNFNKKDFCYDVVVKDESAISKYILDVKITNKILQKHTFILAAKKTYPHNMKIDYCIHHISDDFLILKSTLHDLHPEYDRSFYYIFEVNNKISHYNMFITSFCEFSKYCSWLFPILFEIQKRTDIRGYSEQQARIYGFMAERLFNLYIYHNKIKTKYLPILWFTNQTQPSEEKLLFNFKKFKFNIANHFYYLATIKSFRTYLSNIKYRLHLDKIIANVRNFF